jgi:hypothetical protein
METTTMPAKNLDGKTTARAARPRKPTTPATAASAARCDDLVGDLRRAAVALDDAPMALSVCALTDADREASSFWLLEIARCLSDQLQQFHADLAQHPGADLAQHWIPSLSELNARVAVAMVAANQGRAA